MATQHLSRPRLAWDEQARPLSHLEQAALLAVLTVSAAIVVAVLLLLARLLS